MEMPASTSNLGKSVGAAVGVGAADSAIGGLLGMASARLNYKYNKKLMSLQNQYNIEAFNRELQAVKQMPGLQKEGMRMAGYSTADPSSSGFQQVSPAMSGPSGASMDVDLGRSNLGAALSSFGQFENLKSQTNLNNIEAQYRAKKLQGQIGLYNAQMDEIRATYPERIEEIKANVQNLVSSKKLNDSQASKVLSETENIKAALQGIQMDSKYAELRNKWSVEKLRKETEKVGNEALNLLKEGRILEAKASLADLGIVTGSLLDVVVSASLNGRTYDIVQALKNSFMQLISGSPDPISTSVGSLVGRFFDWFIGLPGAAVEKLYNMWKNRNSE